MKCNADKSGLVAAVGTFDGVHEGHRALLQQVCQTAAAEGLTPAVVTFSHHPLTVLRPQRVPTSLSLPELKRQLLSEAGIGKVITLDFTPELSRLTAREFMSMLREHYNVRHLVIGFNTSMGSDRVAGLDRFKALGRELGMTVSQAGEFHHTGKECLSVCSTTVRHLIADGRVAEAAQLLQRPYSLCGTVVHGHQLGRRLGFPTANLAPEPPGQSIPAAGVYACVVEIEKMGAFGAVVNIGTRPTVDDSTDPKTTIEAYIFGLDADIYGRRIQLKFIERLRDEERFASLDLLRRQMQLDADRASRILDQKYTFR